MMSVPIADPFKTKQPQGRRMARKRVQTKTFWKDIGDLRKPNSTWQLGHAARWFEKKLGLPKGTVAFVRPTGRKARPDKTLQALKAEWMERLL